MKAYDIAKQHIGLQEVRDRKELIGLLKQFAIKNDIVIDPKTTPWCAAFVNAMERAAGNKGTGKLNARSFSKYGSKIEINKAKEGDIVVFTRGSNSWQGHVAYLHKIDKKTNTVICLGGNQNDAVCYAHYSLDRLIDIRRA
jgi:uncharacterized protein (TIGR02594 family)